jgi:hypothetical protein
MTGNVESYNYLTIFYKKSHVEDYFIDLNPIFKYTTLFMISFLMLLRY